MDLKPLVHRAQAGDVKAFVELTRFYQHLAFGSALPWSTICSRPRTSSRRRFLPPGRRCRSSPRRRRCPPGGGASCGTRPIAYCGGPNLEEPPLDEAEEVASDAPTPDRRLEQRREPATALAAIAELPVALREPASLFYAHECSHQDIALFLGIPATTVNNRLHRAPIAVAAEDPDNDRKHPAAAWPARRFANRIGRLVAARSGLVEVVFDPAALPDLLSELLVSTSAPSASRSSSAPVTVSCAASRRAKSLPCRATPPC